MRILFRICSYLLSYVVPVKPGLIICGSWGGYKYNDSPRFLYEKLSVNPAIDIYWYTRSKNIYTRLQSEGKGVLYSKSARTFWMHLRAEILFCNCDSYSDTLGVFSNKNSKIVNLWHGMPIKKIGEDALLGNFKNIGYRRKSILSFIKNLLPVVFLKSLLDKNIYFLVNSRAHVDIFCRAKNINRDRIILSSSLRAEYVGTNNHFCFPESNLKIIYVPTYRGELNSEFSLKIGLGMDLEHVHNRLLDEKSTLAIRLHPANKPNQDELDFIDGCDNIFIDRSPDLYEEINRYDLVITDFSSVYFDCLEMRIPIIILPCNLDNYLNDDRRLYFNLDELYPFKVHSTWMELMDNFASLYSMDFNSLEEVRERFCVDIDKGVVSDFILNKVRKLR